MKKVRKAAVSTGLLLGAAFSLLAGDGQWTSEGPPAVSVYSLGLGTPGTFFAATASGMLRSTEPGVWTPILSEGSNPTIVAVDPADPATLYVEAEAIPSGFQALFKSTDSGDHFQILYGFPVVDIRAIAIDPTNSSTLYIGGDNGSSGVVFKSADGGTEGSWTFLSTYLLVNTIASLVIDPHRNDYVYAGSDLYVSSSYYYYVAPPPGATDALIATQNGGAKWTGLLQGGSSADVPGISVVAVDPQSGTIYAGIRGGGAVLRSSDSGTTWASSSVGLGLQVEGINALVVDPTSSTTIYAGTTAAGVFRSLDGGSSWTPMSDGLEADERYQSPGLWVHSLVFDPVGGVLRAGTENGVFAIRPNVASAPCTRSAEYLCLLGGRYRVSVMAQDPSTYVVERGVVVQNVDRFGSFSLPAFTGDPGFPEVIVKMIAAPAGPGAWVFFGGLTSLPYVLSVTDTTTGRIETYSNDSQNHLCGGADTAAFAGIQAPAARSLARAQTRASAENGALSLLGNRFSVTLSAVSASQGRTEPGVAVPVTDRYGYFSLPGFTGDPTFPEVFVKMVDFTAINGQFWFFQTGLTNLTYTLTVTDSVTGAVKTYTDGGDYCGGVNAFAD